MRVLTRRCWWIALCLAPISMAAQAETIIGLIFATLLTLGVVPVLYSLFFRVEWVSDTH